MKAKTTPRVVADFAHVEEVRPVPYAHWFGVIPASVEPSRPIRFLGTATMVAAFVAFVVDLAVVAAAHAMRGTPDPSSILDDMNGGAAWLLDHLTLGQIDHDTAVGWVGSAQDTVCVIAGIVAAVCAIVAAGMTWRWAARPHVVGVRHLRGPRLLEGDEALAEARRHAIQRKKGDKTQWPRFALPLLHAARVWLPKDVLSRGILVYGSPGAGKTVMIAPLVRALILWPKAKALVWDPKADFTARFFGRPGVAILSPYDARSVVWDVGVDCRTPTDAQALAAVLASGGGTSGKEAQGDFFAQAATTVLTAALETIQSQHGTAWGWDTFAKMFSTDRASILKTLIDAGHAEVDELIGTADAKSASIMATVGNAISITRTLGRAWPYRADRSAAERFAIREWMRDDYDVRTRPRIIMCKGDDFPDIMGRCLVAMTNLLAVGVNGLPDDERGRCLAVVCDEIAALRSRISIAELVGTGRSKGIVPVLGLQDLHQLVPIYGPDTTKALASMLGVHVVGRTNMGATRDEISAHLGKRVVAVRPHGLDAPAVAEQEQTVVSSSYITHALGPFGRVVERDKHGRKHARPAGVRMLVHGLGPDILRLEWPIEPSVPRAPGKVAAPWTLGKDAAFLAGQDAATSGAGAESAPPKNGRGMGEATAADGAAAPAASSALRTGDDIDMEWIDGGVA